MSLALDKNQIIIINDICGDYDQNIQLICMVREISKLTQKEIIVYEFHPANVNKIKTYFDFGADLVVDATQENLTIQGIGQFCYDEICNAKPFLLAFGNGHKNRELAAALSVMLEAGLVADCFDLRLQENREKIVFTRAAIKSSVLADIVCENSPTQMCTIKKGCCLPTKILQPRPLNICRYNGGIQVSQRGNSIHLLNKFPIKKADISLDQNAKLIIGIGRGAAKHLNKIRLLAAKMNAIIGASKPMVEEGIMLRNQQIGQSGQSVSSDVYLALGISGAMQHVVGITAVKTVISVNTNKNAQIRQYSNFFIHDDVRNVVDELLS